MNMTLVNITGAWDYASKVKKMQKKSDFSKNPPA